MRSPLEIPLIIVVSCVIFVNGWTDAPNAIAGIVSTKAMSYRKAVWFAAVFNMLGLLVMSMINGSVADTVTSMADFSGDAVTSLAALLSAMAAIVIFAAAAWRFGIPTSESHALIAALSGAALASAGKISPGAWGKILFGLAMSLALGFFLGGLFVKLLGGALQKLPARLLDKFQITAAGIMAFMHGAQDGQKFAAVFVIAEMLAKNRYNSGPVNLKEHLLVLLFCALVMSLGTSVGGKRIIDTVGTKMVPLQKHQSVCADLGSGLCLLIASLTGIPLSTTHTKTTAIMGACITKSPDKKHPADLKIIGEMFLAWGITFPVCAALGFALARLALVVL